MLTFYTNPMSCGRIVRWMPEDVGLPHETVLLEACRARQKDRPGLKAAQAKDNALIPEART